jgi:hypothetical protein
MFLSKTVWEKSVSTNVYKRTAADSPKLIPTRENRSFRVGGAPKKYRNIGSHLAK